MEIQQGDVILFQTEDGGNVEVENGLMTMSGGLQTSAYLSLFGGNRYEINTNEETETFKEWWGNIGELEVNQYISETQNIIDGLPATSSNLLKLEQSVLRDLNWMIEEKIASEINVNISIPLLNVVKFQIDIDQEQFEFIENWRNQ